MPAPSRSAGTGNEIENETGGSVIGSGTNSLTNTGTLEVAGTLTLLDDLVTNTGGTVTVDATDTLDPDRRRHHQQRPVQQRRPVKVTGTGNEIENETGGTPYTVGTNSLTNTGTLEVAGTLTLLDDLVTNTGGTVTVDATDTLILTGGDTINNGQFNNAGTVKVTGTGNEIENETGGTVIGSGTNSLTNTGTLEVAGTLTLLDDLVTNTGGTVTVDATDTLI